MKIPIKKTVKGPPPETAQFEYSRWGEKIMIYPEHRIWVVNGLTGTPMLKEKAIFYDSRDGQYFYVPRGTPKLTEAQTYALYPSRW